MTIARPRRSSEVGDGGAGPGGIKVEGPAVDLGIAVVVPAAGECDAELRLSTRCRLSRIR